MSSPLRPIEERFWKKVSPEPNTGCWLWTGATQRNGYGVIKMDYPSKRNVAAHRFSWALVNGAIPDGMVVCHKCDNPPCVNPDHLYAGTLKDNARDMVERGRARYGMKITFPYDLVELVRAEYAAGGISTTQLSKKHGISVAHVGRIVNNQRRREQ